MSIDEDWERMARKYNEMRNGFSGDKTRKCFKKEGMVYHVRRIVVLLFFSFSLNCYIKMTIKSWPLYLVWWRSLMALLWWCGRDKTLEWQGPKLIRVGSRENGGKKVVIIFAHLPDYFLKTNFYNKFLWGPFHPTDIVLIHISLNNPGLKILSIHWPSVFLLLWTTFLFISCSYQFVSFKAKLRIKVWMFLRHYISSIDYPELFHPLSSIHLSRAVHFTDVHRDECC